MTEGRTAWFQPLAGIAGDMAMGALVDAGASPDAIQQQLAALGLEGWELEFKRVQRRSLAATRAVVRTETQHHHRRWRDIRELLADAPLEPEVQRRAQEVFERLAHAEAAVHGIEPDDVHFHEVGALDAIVDVVGTAAALVDLGVSTVACGPVAVGTGTVNTEHGRLGNPPPAVVKLLAGFDTYGVDTKVELTTPTGAAIVAAWAGKSSPLPAMTVTSSGFGAGTAELDAMPNVTGVVVGVASSRDVNSSSGEAQSGATDALTVGTTVEQVVELRTNLDDVTGEQLGQTIAALLEAGALDAWVVSAVGKKSRPTNTLHVLCRPEHEPALTARVMELTGTLGVRAAQMLRSVAPRSEVIVRVGGHPVTVKLGPHRAKAQFDEAAAAAAALGRPVADVASEAEAAARQGLPPKANSTDNRWFRGQ